MKKTKLFCGILIGLMIFSSCSSDDDGNNDGNNDSSIIGTWKTTKEIFVDSGGIMTTNNRDDCEQMGRIVFSSNGSFSESGFFSGMDSSGNCIQDTNNSGQWEIINGNTLRITLTVVDDNGYIGDYLIVETTNNTLKIDADLDESSIEKEIYELEKVN